MTLRFSNQQLTAFGTRRFAESIQRLLIQSFPDLSWLGSMLSPLANWAITNGPSRWLMEKVLGVARGRKLPRFAARSFLVGR